MEQISITSAYMWAFITMAVFFLLAVIISNLILFKPNDPGTVKRRICFWSLCIATGAVGYIINNYIATDIEVPALHSNYMTHAAIASGASVAAYIVIGFIVSKCSPNSKVGTWF